ncbi:hypothetical protein TRAPUB_14289 [Trametes pubescens]|uniref:Uncharacterized protein n=1 Tax=Trametes pubescens TaxID=154538 RepID=A0A1M2VP38_TRAPU|nr:hypothetical protein TRAPUB_14289 [Trametes pubescens]
MELDFVLANLQHPDITVRLPTWIDRFARGELPECADTFGRLIHKLACNVAVPSPSGRNECPRGCAIVPMGRRRRGGQGNYGNVSASNTEPPGSPQPDPLPLPAAERHPAASPTSGIVPFWEKPIIIPFWEKTDNVPEVDGEEDKTRTDNGDPPSTEGGDKPKEPHDQQQMPPPQADTPAETVKNTTFTYKMTQNTNLEDAGQYALNASISSGRFEDLRVLAFSRRISPNRVGAPRAMYANSALVTRALPSLFQGVYCQHHSGFVVLTDREDERLDEVSDAGLALCDDISVSATYYGYSEDSDLDDDQSDGPENSDNEAESASCDRKDEDETPAKHTPPCPVAANPAEYLRRPPPKASSDVVDLSTVGPPYPHIISPAQRSCLTQPAAPGASSSRDEAEDFVSADGTTPTESEATPGPGPQVQTDAKAPPKPTLKIPEANARMALYSPLGSEGLRTIFAVDTAYGTWRAVVFYAYTHRVVFAPLRSQGFPFKPADEDDPSQLPICSPKSMYRLAMKVGHACMASCGKVSDLPRAQYGNAELERLAGDDIATKLSTQNALTELFSHFTSRYPQIRDMELNFVVAHLKHPHIVVELPTWIDRFARGELKECADTFGRLIHKLACAATAAPGGVVACPRGCAMSTVQHRCTMCGLTFS